MRSTLGFAVRLGVLLIVASCGRSQSPTPAPSAGPVSHLTLTAEKEHHEARGRAFAWEDRGTNVLTIAVIADGSAPAATCENVKTIGGGLEKGALLSVGVGGFKGAPGSLDLVGYGWLVTDCKDNVHMGGQSGFGGDAPLPSVLTITKLTKDSLDGSIVAKPGGPASGEIHATLCEPTVPTTAAAPAAPILTSLAGPDPTPPTLATGESYLSVSVVDSFDKPAHGEVKGTAIAWLEADGPLHRLAVGVFEPGTMPAPDCTNIEGYAQGMVALKKGHFALIRGRTVPKGSTHDVENFVIGEPGNGGSKLGITHVDAWDNHAAVFEITKQTDAIVELKVSSKPLAGARARAAGTLFAKLCPKK